MRKTMKSILRRSKSILIIALALMFSTMSGGLAIGADIMKIKPKGDKKIKIGVIDPMAAIEVAAVFNKFHKEAAEARGWDLEYYDLKDNIPQSIPFMENMIAAGYDGIIIHWLPLKPIEKQIKKAFELGIPIITLVANGARMPGIVADCGPMVATQAAMSAEYLASNLQPDDKILTLTIPVIEMHQTRLTAAKGVFKAYKIEIGQELYFPLTGDPMQWSYDNIKNALLGDTKKEIKGLWTSWEGFSIQGARAAKDIGRDDFKVVAVDDSPNTYTQLRKLPTFIGTAGMVCRGKEINGKIFEIFDKVFKGEPVETQEFYGVEPWLITKENLPPKGYFFNPCGYEGRPPDFPAK
jgi:ABC-type sugar transport system substrate-binding protein